MGFTLVLFTILVIICNFHNPLVMAANVDPSCDYYQEAVIGQTYYINNEQYPNNYGSNTACRWVAISEIGTNIVISCTTRIPNTQGCSGDRLAISATGNGNFDDARNYCGSGSISYVSNKNSLAVGLFSSPFTTGGSFVCSLTVFMETTTTTSRPPNNCNCGWKQGTRIVNGRETGVNEYPAMAALIDYQKRENYCGGTIISERYIITAAHCVYNMQVTNIGVLVGDHNLATGQDTAYSSLYNVLEYQIHPDYNSFTYINDIAIIKTNTFIAFSLYVGPICLPFRYSERQFDGNTVTALGWGQLDFSEGNSETLQEVDLSVVNTDYCHSRVNDKPVTGNNLCTYTPGKDTCLADSGGPILWMEPTSRRLQLVGIISFGNGCATSVPSVNTRVTSFLAWIIQKTSDASYCIR